MRGLGRRGSASVEFALTLPILIMLALGIIEYGWLFHEYNLVHTALRDAARAGAKNGLGDTLSASTAAQVRLLENLNHYGICVGVTGLLSCSYQAQAGTPADTIYLSVTMPYEPITGFPAPGLPGRVKAEITWAIEP